MAIVNLGSINIDLVYRVPHIVAPGETLGAVSRQVFAGGKGANQTVALARAGAKVYHAGRIGEDGRWILAKLADAGADTSLVEFDDGPTGHAVIQVSDDGENSIIIDGGANRRLDAAQIERTLSRFGPGDTLVLQNEVSGVAEAITRASARGMRVCLTPAPMDEAATRLPLEQVAVLLVNRSEGRALAGLDDAERAVGQLQRRTGGLVVMTLGGDGAVASDGSDTVRVPAYGVNPVDTTAAGDTFAGYFLASLSTGAAPAAAMTLAARAAAICVTRPGAMDSIPTREEVAKARLPV
mgnify:CR=1 FL=1